MCAYRLGSSVCLFLRGADMFAYAFQHNVPSIAAFTSHHLHHPTPPPLFFLPRAAFLFIFARSSRVFLKLFRSVEIHQVRRGENNGGAQVNRERRSRQRKQWSLNYWVPSFSITSHVPGLMACFFLSFFSFYPPSAAWLIDGKISRTSCLEKKRKNNRIPAKKLQKNKTKNGLSSTSHCHIWR